MEKDRIESLVTLAQGGDLQAMEQLLEAAYTPVSYQCRKMMPRQEDAEDLTQEVLLAVYQKLGTLKEAKAFWSWIHRITATHCINALNRNRVDLQFAEDEDGHSVVDDLEELDEHSIPDKALDNAETVRMVDEIVSALPEAQRMTTLLYYYNEMSVKEIAQIMNVPENTVKSRLNLARKTIKDKVLDHEKQGVKLYGVSVLPFLWYFLRTAAKNQANPGSAVACASGVIANAAVATTTAATSATVTGTVIAGIAAKIVAGCLAFAVTIGGAVLYFAKQGHTGEMSQTTTNSEYVTDLPETSNPTTSVPSLNDMAMEAYDALLRRGYTDDSMVICYYAYLDIDHDDVNELIVADNNGTPDAWTVCELYTYDENGLAFCGSTNSRYDYLYYVNEEYLVGKHRMGDQYLTTSGLIDFNGSIKSSEIIELKENPYTFDIDITESEALQIFYSAKAFYDAQIYGKRFLDSSHYSANDFDWIEGVIEYNGSLYAPCGKYTYDEFVQNLQTLFSSNAVNRLIGEVGLLEYNGKCYTYIREGAGDPVQGDYEASVQLKGNVIFEIQVSFSALDGSSVTKYVYCRKENDSWIIDGFNFYGE